MNNETETQEPPEKLTDCQKILYEAIGNPNTDPDLRRDLLEGVNRAASGAASGAASSGASASKYASSRYDHNK